VIAVERQRLLSKLEVAPDPHRDDSKADDHHERH
jgi:hypothetical protein